MLDTSILTAHMKHFEECSDDECFRCLYIRNFESWHQKLPWLRSSVDKTTSSWHLSCATCGWRFSGPGNFSNVKRHELSLKHTRACEDAPAVGGAGVLFYSLKCTSAGLSGTEL